MIKVTEIYNGSPISAQKMCVGNIAIMDANSFCVPNETNYILRVYSGFVHLNNPYNTWDNNTSSLQITRILPAGTRIMLEVGETEEDD